jgi:hypothetical protein
MLSVRALQMKLLPAPMKNTKLRNYNSLRNRGAAGHGHRQAEVTLHD